MTPRQDRKKTMIPILLKKRNMREPSQALFDHRMGISRSPLPLPPSESPQKPFHIFCIGIHKLASFSSPFKQFMANAKAQMSNQIQSPNTKSFFHLNFDIHLTFGF